jgi:hypothetical protein
MLEDVHEVLPKVEKETGVSIRFLAAIRRIPLTIVKDAYTSTNYLRENLDALKAIAKEVLPLPLGAISILGLLGIMFKSTVKS